MWSMPVYLVHRPLVVYPVTRSRAPFAPDSYISHKEDRALLPVEEQLKVITSGTMQIVPLDELKAKL